MMQGFACCFMVLGCKIMGLGPEGLGLGCSVYKSSDFRDGGSGAVFTNSLGRGTPNRSKP